MLQLLKRLCVWLVPCENAAHSRVGKFVSRFAWLERVRRVGSVEGRAVKEREKLTTRSRVTLRGCIVAVS